MPYKDQRKTRGATRTYRHGNWRAVLVQYNFTCASYSNGSIPEDCEGIENLELHEPFGEIKPKQLPLVQGKMQSRILLCISCHPAAHNYSFPYGRGNSSTILEDAEAEIREEGGYEQWLRRYGLDVVE